MEYILKVFGRLSESGGNLTEYEAAAFLPYLVMKVGDSKDNIRRDIRAIFRLVVTLYPPARFYPFLINGLKSKVNKARQGKESPPVHPLPFARPLNWIALLWWKIKRAVY
ncbi:unnamed protein product [Dibothriocephalus latus]|uniref:FAT domain-containing protein n=1 Tax=Dibothriocephalus latus TaxID=60516 RepID=A0A3P7MWH9_DIBLA|nr:unnamed protein product [Dibothriocephalus latus]